MARLLDPDDVERLRGGQNVPLAIQQRIAGLLQEARNSGWIDALEWHAMDRNLDALSDA